MIRLLFLLPLLSFSLYAKDVSLDKNLIPKSKDSFLNFSKEYLYEEVKSAMGDGSSRWLSKYLFYYDEKTADSLYELASSNKLVVNKYKNERVNIRGKLYSVEVVDEGVVFVLGAFVGDNKGYILSLFDKADKRMLQMSSGDKISVRCNILSGNSNKFVVTNNCVFKEDHINDVYNMLFNKISEDFKTNDVKVSYYLESEIAFVYKLYESKFEKLCSNKHRCYEAINFIRNEKETPGYVKGSLKEKIIKFSEENIGKYKEVIPNVN
ncbi:hypothetical protein [Xenorhabdus siamensis]|uniref:hypothetical protein n=1 Tax=Xenorhabdus siamensis TaxID=3136254 RepID=UPI0030F4A36A